jgi:large subunit ribosomal protein L30e
MQEIKKLFDEGKLVLGTKVTMKKIRSGNISKIFFAKNCKPELKEDILSLIKNSDIEVVISELNNDELGTYCKKPFHVSVIGVLKN